tara:strand:+ start:552 stop:818 length:267 start_codon:yes stop_codon:yes gene_type:complete
MIKVDVIASFDNHNQEWFEINIPQEYLDNDKTIVNFLLRQLDNVSDLYKLSLCWICNEETVNNFRGIKDSLNHNGKYYFTNGMLEECV